MGIEGGHGPSYLSRSTCVTAASVAVQTIALALIVRLAPMRVAIARFAGVGFAAGFAVVALTCARSRRRARYGARQSERTR